VPELVDELLDLVVQAVDVGAVLHVSRLRVVLPVRVAFATLADYGKVSKH
jgi:hypothetical protein